MILGSIGPYFHVGQLNKERDEKFNIYMSF